MEPKKYILLSNEVEAYVEAIEIFDVEQVGSPRWMSQHLRICKLSMQAVMNAVSKEEELVKEILLTYNKTPILIHELILIEIWKKKIFPELMKKELPPSSHMHLYGVLFHEATIMTFLEAVMFHQEVMEAADEVLMDMIDYCHRNIPLLKDSVPQSDPENLQEPEDLQKANDTLAFEIGMKAISLLSYVSQNINRIPLSAMHRLLNIHDTPLLLANLISDAPWRRILPNGEFEMYSDCKWNRVGDDKVSKTEGQLWMSLYKLLLDPECQKKYQFNNFRKGQIMKLKSKINDMLIDQIPLLSEMLRFLEHLSVFNPPPAKPDIIIEQVSEIWDLLMKENGDKWTSIAENQRRTFFSYNADGQLPFILEQLASAYDMEDLEAVLPSSPKCGNCGAMAEKRCSQCKNEWYCGRECQVKHWERHKQACLLMIKEKD